MQEVWNFQLFNALSISVLKGGICIYWHCGPQNETAQFPLFPNEKCLEKIQEKIMKIFKSYYEEFIAPN